MARDEVSDNELDEDLAPKRRGRPRKRGVVTTTVTKRELDDDDDDEDEAAPREVSIPSDTSLAATFSSFVGSPDENKRLARVRVTRVDPDEGILTTLTDLNATEQTIHEQFGGGTFQLAALNAKGGYLRSTTIKLSGDPIFRSEIAEFRWRKSLGLPPKAAGVVPGQLSQQELIRLMDEREERRRRDDIEREERRRREDKELEDTRRTREREFQLQREKDIRDAEDRKRREEDDRRRRDREDDERRERQRQQDMQERDARNQQFMASMLASVRESAAQSLQLVTAMHKAEGAGGPGGIMDAVKLIVAVKDAFGDGDGDKDPLSLLLNNAEGILNGIGNAASAAIREAKGGAAAGPPGHVVPGHPLPAALAPAAAPASSAPPAGMELIPAELQPKVMELVGEMVKRGMDPKEALGQLIEGSTAALRGQPVVTQPAAAPPARAPQQPAAPAERKLVGIRVSFVKA